MKVHLSLSQTLPTFATRRFRPRCSRLCLKWYTSNSSTRTLNSLLLELGHQFTGERPLRDEAPAGRLRTIEEDAPSRGSSQAGHREHDTSGSESGTLSLSPPPPRHLRSSLSSPNLHLTSPVSALPPRSKSPQPSRYADFPDGPQVDPGKRPWIRRVLDASSCINCEKFDERDFARVRPARFQTDFFREMEVDASNGEEKWRKEISKNLYPGANPSDVVCNSDTTPAIVV